jgi:hypothetical protein
MLSPHGDADHHRTNPNSDKTQGRVTRSLRDLTTKHPKNTRLFQNKVFVLFAVFVVRKTVLITARRESLSTASRCHRRRRP